MNALPKYVELIDPMIKVICNVEKPMTNKEIESGVIELLGIPRELVSVIHYGKRTELQYRLGWAKTRAKSLGYLTSPARETWEVTPKGRARVMK